MICNLLLKIANTKHTRKILFVTVGLLTEQSPLEHHLTPGTNRNVPEKTDERSGWLNNSSHPQMFQFL